MDWNHITELLKQDTKSAVERFLAGRPGESLGIIGYVFELQNCYMTFEICAELRSGRGVESWNSGDFQHPAGLNASGDWSAPFLAAIEMLDASDQDGNTEIIYAVLVGICVKALAELAGTGTFGNWRNIKFNVAGIIAGAEDGDDVVKERDQKIRQLIAAASPN